MHIHDAIDALTKAVLQMQGRQLATEFAVKELMSHHPDPAGFLAHWEEANSRFVDYQIDEQEQTAQVLREAMHKQLADFHAEIESFVEAQRKMKR